MKILGIDYGSKRIGISLSDEGMSIAFPKEILKNDKSCFEILHKLIKEENVQEIVIGESLDLNGLENKVQGQIKFFVKEIESKFNLKVSFQKEFMTSVEARKTKIFKSNKDKTQASSRVKKEVGEKVDAKAAALILQRYLDKKNKLQV